MRNFRPPPGFMDAGGAPEAPAASAPDPEAMLDRIQSGAGHWHQLAKLLPALQRAGWDSTAVEERTGLERKAQHLWSTAAQVYDSLAASGPDPRVLAHYDQPGAENLLYELRYLSLQQRLATADYAARRQLDAHQCLVLARAVKEHERRDGCKEGFSESPADCLAYKHYRDAHECRLQEDVEACVQKGLAVVETEAARAKLMSMLHDAEEASTSALPTAKLTVLRLTRDEVGCRPVAVVGRYGAARAEAVRCAPKVSSEGVFGTFTVPPEGVSWQWVPLPAWAVLSLAGRPVALTVANCGDVAAMRVSSAVKTEAEAKKLQGEGLMVVDASPGDKSVVPEEYYAVAAADGGVDVVAGAAVGAGVEVLGPVLFVVRPPSREAAANTTSELLSV